MTYENNNIKYPFESTADNELSLTETERIGIENILNYRIQCEVNQLIEEQGDSLPKENFYLKERRSKEINTSYGTVTLEIPRFKKFSYFPSFLQPYCHNDDLLLIEIDEMIDRGLSLRNLAEVYQELGLDYLSYSSLGRHHNKANEEVLAFQSRRFDDQKYLNLMIDAFYVPVMLEGIHGRYCKKLAVVVVIGLNAKTRCYEYLSIKTYPNEGKECISRTLKDLIGRGLNPRTIITSDSGSGITAGICADLSFSAWNPCQFHEIKACLDKLSRKDQVFKEEALKVYHAESLSEARKLYDELVEKYKPTGSCQPALKVIEKSLNKGTPFREIKDKTLSKAVSTSNRLEGCNSANRRRLDPVHVFWSEKSLLNYLIRFALLQQERWRKKKSDLLESPIEEFYKEFQEKAQKVYEEANEIVKTFNEKLTTNLKDFQPDQVWINIVSLPVMKDQSQYSVPLLQVFGEMDKEINLLYSKVLEDQFSETIEEALLELKEKGFSKKKNTLFILSGSERSLTQLVKKLFKTDRIQFDREQFTQSLFNYVPASLRDDVKCFLDCIFSYSDLKAARELAQTLCAYLKMHHLNQALEMFEELLGGLLKIIEVGIVLPKMKLSLKSFKPGDGYFCPLSKGLCKKPRPARETFQLVFADWI